ncbi:nucleotidyltransferase domain-containing protein [Deinococcus cellulosilyticus]|uniref:Polymerase nucleotidyl transferase domain-containing protein n=1 Tax=Deinococcus cellulosilyticus (strain DSM 18568 / NBRC 106333 / KACC 11606 / 5516J-15) TaxID=1223518 RepID=A0A511MW63_DEIC1|nr:nucleotidyltransferase domain-containing protein [Deinococcus cellulosilyticus]GEM44641.1 hypothetical protein DC3_02760 [Deinococcus cellulosilyticus NBRC 106333 = KACC 11606]
MLNVFEVADVLVQHIRQTCAEDIALVAYYGSYAQGTATLRSDLDFFFIPATEKGYRQSFQFVVEDIAFDFWPISWERADKMARFEEGFTTLIADSVVIHVRSEHDHQRFLKLREQIAERQQPDSGHPFEALARQHIKQVFEPLYQLRQQAEKENLAGCVDAAAQILSVVLQTLALLNRTYFRRGWGKNLDQVRAFVQKPGDLEVQITRIMEATQPQEVQEHCEGLVQDTLDLLIRAHPAKQKGCPDPSRVTGWFEEACGVLDKLLTACEMGDHQTLFFYLAHIQQETFQMLGALHLGEWKADLGRGLYRELQFPDLMPHLIQRDFYGLHHGIENLKKQLEQHLVQSGVTVHRFPGIRALQEALKLRT